MAAAKIVIIGGGSCAWGPLFVRDLLITPSLAGSSIVLHDIDADALDRVYRLGQAMLRYGDYPFYLQQMPNLSAALQDADFVILTITTGGLEAMRHDVEIPARYGVYHSVGDTVGPGGLARGLRNIPVVVDLAQRMEVLCPDAWLLNYTNPMSTLCRAVTRETSIRTVGLCHEWFHVRRRLAAYFQAPIDALDARIAGINHLIWLLDLRIQGKSAMSRLHALAGQILATQGQVPGFMDEDPRSTIDRALVKARLLQVYGALPVAGDRHVAEFFPFFLSEAAERGRKWGIDRTTIDERYQWRAEDEREMDALQFGAQGLDDYLAAPSGEAAHRIIDAIANRGRYSGVLNLPNRGQIPDLPRDAVVETLGEVDADGARGYDVGELPPAIRSLLLRHIATQELTVEAALTGDRTLALQALLNDPMCPPDLEAAEEMLEEMLTANRRHLPNFF